MKSKIVLATSLVAILIMISSCNFKIHEEANDYSSDFVLELENDTTEINIDSIEDANLDQQLESEVAIVAEQQNEDEYSDYLKDIIIAAEQNDAEAQNILAYYYYNGIEVEKDIKKSFEWSLKSAENGNLASMFNVGFDYYNGYYNELDYHKAFEWYEKAAEKSFPKALNALGEMYYTGKGIDVNHELAYDYTLQSSGFLHIYSFSNMGAMIDDLSLEGDSNSWYRNAARNYMIPSSGNGILYDRLINAEIDINVVNQVENDTVTDELIQEILFRYYSGTLCDYLDVNSSKYMDFRIDELGLNDEIYSIIDYRRWYDTNYLVDIDDDGNKDLLVYQLDGTIGTSSFRVIRNIDDEFIINEDETIYDLMHGINGLITYNDQLYFVVGNIDIGNRSIFSVSIYAIQDGMLLDSVRISTNEISTEILKTYQLDLDYDGVVDKVEIRANEMFITKYDSLLYDKVNEFIELDFDIDNDGQIEHYEFESVYWGTINRPISIEFREELSSEDDIDTIYPILQFGDYAMPLGIEVFSHDGINYVSVLSYDLGTTNYSFTTFLLLDNEAKVVSNHLITMKEEFIIMEESGFWNQ